MEPIVQKFDLEPGVVAAQIGSVVALALVLGFAVVVLWRWSQRRVPREASPPPANR